MSAVDSLLLAELPLVYGRSLNKLTPAAMADAARCSKHGVKDKTQWHRSKRSQQDNRNEEAVTPVAWEVFLLGRKFTECCVTH